MAQINHDVWSDMQEQAELEAFISMHYSLVDLEAGIITCANAGMEPPVGIPAEGDGLIEREAQLVVRHTRPGQGRHDDVYQKRLGAPSDRDLGRLGQVLNGDLTAAAEQRVKTAHDDTPQWGIGRVPVVGGNRRGDTDVDPDIATR